MGTLIYKIVPTNLWQDAMARGIFEGAPVDLADGFIHFSTAEQAREFGLIDKVLEKREALEGETGPA